MASPTFHKIDVRTLVDSILTRRVAIPSCGELHEKSPMVHQPHAVPAAKLLLVVDGQLRYFIQGASIRLDAGSMLYRPAMSSASWKAIGDTSLDVQYCEFSADGVKFPQEAMWSVMTNPELEREAFLRIRQAFLDPDETAIYRAVAELKAVLTRFFLQANSVRPDHKSKRGRNGVAGERAIQAALAYISENFPDESILSGLHERVRMSESYFRRLFRRITGLSPQQYVMRVRMTAAKSQLERSNLSVKEVARAAGYQDALYFSRVYRRYFGHTPTDDRNLTA
jgi:AraC-like DNA-binding protein